MRSDVKPEILVENVCERRSLSNLYPASRAFTLPELLVVIALLALMAGLLFPAIQKGMGVAQATKCLSNLNQCGLGLLAYSSEKNGRLLSLEKNWIILVWPYVYPTRELPSISGNAFPPDLKGTVFQCPRTDKDPTEVKRSYAYNYKLIDNSSATEDILVSIPDRSKCALLGKCSATSTMAGASLIERHASGCNLFFADGHAEPIRITDAMRNLTDKAFWGRP